ncbi:MAG: polysaccharide biosynthesis protein [Clostridiales bacterium]|nr:polysaccharide biosynthesis protein [Clostridiales bacterium]
MGKHSFIISAIILTMGGFFAKAIGALYKIPLTNILGSNGIGLYYLVFPVYSLIIVLCSSGIAVAVSTEVAKCRKLRHRYNEQKILQVSIVLSFILSLVLTIITLCLSRVLAEAQGNVNVRIGYIAIAPSIIISSLIATVRGYFQGIENMVPTTVSLIIEQIVKLSVGLILAYKLSVFGINYAVLGAILGVTFSELVAVIVITINFVIYKGQLDYNYRRLICKTKRRFGVIGYLKNKAVIFQCDICRREVYRCLPNRQRYSNKEAMLKIIKIAIPSTLSGLILPIATMLDSFLIINILNSSGVSTMTSTALYGLFGGVVQSLISLPIIVISAISTALVPSLSGLVVHNDTNELVHRINFFIKITWLVSIIAVVFIYVFAEGIIEFLYGDGLINVYINEFEYAVKLLQMNSVSIIYSAFLQTNTVILQVTGGASAPFWASLVALPIRVLLLRLLVAIPDINIYGAVISNTLYLATINIALTVIIKKKIALEYQFYKHLFKPVLIGMVCLFIGLLGYNFLSQFVNYLATICIVSIVIFLVYVIWIYFGKVLTRKEKEYLCFRKKITKKSNRM